MATSMSIQQPLDRLTQRVVLAEFLDSLARVNFVILIEEMFNIDVSDENAEALLTFEDTLRYAGRYFGTNGALE